MNARPRVPGTALALTGLGLFFALLFATQNYVQYSVMGPSASWRGSLISALARWLPYAALAPLVGWLVERFPLERRRLPARVPLHLFASVAFAVVHCAIVAVIFRLLHLYPTGSTIAEAFGRLMMTLVGVDMIVYWAISVSYHALRYQREIRSRELQAAELRSSLTEARLQALRAQLNPHFLFNTLNATSALALAGQGEQVVQTLSCLSDILRVSFDRDLPQEIPLASELGILGGYLEIQRIRFGDRLTVELDIEPATRDALLPSMILQPLAENAFEHGISACPGPGHVVIRSAREADSLVLTIEDNGPGFGVAATAARADRGIGLANTTARLEQLYGKFQSLERGNLDNGGAFVHVRIPFHVANGTEGGPCSER